MPQPDRVRKAQEGVGAGAVVLVHDTSAGAADGAAEDNGTVEEPVVDRFDLVDRVLTAYGARGLRARSSGDALAHGTLVREARFPA